MVSIPTRYVYQPSKTMVEAVEEEAAEAEEAEVVAAEVVTAEEVLSPYDGGRY